MSQKCADRVRQTQWGLEITKLREDLRKKQGAEFDLGKFHDDFMSQGYPPISIVRRALLGDDSPTL